MALSSQISRPYETTKPIHPAPRPFERRYGFDFHPQNEFFRIVNWQEINVRFYPDTLEVIRDTPLTLLTLPPSPYRSEYNNGTGIQTIIVPHPTRDHLFFRLEALMAP